MSKRQRALVLPLGLAAEETALSFLASLACIGGVGQRIPPIGYFFASLILGSLLQHFWPRTIADYSFIAGMGLGLTTLFAATLLAAWAIRVMRRQGTSIEPGGTPARLVTCGPFRFSRNPLYVALLLVSGGLAIMMNSRWLALGTGALLLLLDRLVVIREEALLLRTFETEFSCYASRVRRWL